MSTSSNLYAEKVFAEHPLALWALDESTDYVSLITEAQRSISAPSWLVVGAATSQVDSPEHPTKNLPGVVNTISPTLVPNGSIGTVQMSSPILVDVNTDISSSIKTFAISTYIHPLGKSLDLSIGYTYSIGGVPQAPVGVVLPVDDLNSWAFISESFVLPSSFEDLRVFMQVSYTSTGTQYSFITNGLCVGQWLEQFSLESLGVQLEDINASRVIDIAIDGYGSIANSYGLQSLDGYYLSENNVLCASNTSIPMVFGSTGSTKITPRDSGPSLIIPGLGFMNQSGQYNDLTFEMWIKIKTSAIDFRKIFGPIASSDGLYINDAFLTLRVGSNSKSYFIGEWDRPMLLAIRLSKNLASLVVNGEEVISMNVITDNLDFVSKYSDSGKDNDWLGFYSYPDVPVIELDCLGIYPYKVSNIVEKRRWIYGQAVKASENINGLDTAANISFDYPVSNYAKNYSYPDIGRWSQGINENLSIDNRSLSLPQYSLPEIAFSRKSLSDWTRDVEAIQDSTIPFMTLRPNSAWDNIEGYVLFPQLTVLNQKMQAFYALMSVDATNNGNQTLFYLENEITKDVFEAQLQQDEIVYTLKSLNSDGSTSVQFTLTKDAKISGGFFAVGLSIDSFVNVYGGRLSAFFGSRKNIKLYVGGSHRLENTFSGKIYRIGFGTTRNIQKVSAIFTPDGTVAGYDEFETSVVSDGGSTPTTIRQYEFDAGNSYFGNSSSPFSDIADGGSVYSILAEYILDHIASYTLIPKMFLGSFSLDVGVNGYWQDYTPLSYFGKNIVNEGGIITFGLDYLQFNVGYPQSGRYINNAYDTLDSTVKTYISFQYLDNPSTTNISAFTVTQPAPQSGVIYPGTNWQTTKYEVVDNMIIYPPSNVDFKTIALVTHVEALSKGIKENPIKIQSLQIASQALNSFIPTDIGTKYGASVFSYTKAGVYYDYKGKNPFTIYKGSTPHMYMTSTSGITPKDTEGYTVDRGIYIPINSSASDFYRVSAWQMALRYDKEIFPAFLTEIFEIEHYDSTNNPAVIKFYLSPEDSSGKRAKIYAVDVSTGLMRSDIVFYVNGKEVKTPYINLSSWMILGISFANPLVFDGNVGALRFTGPLSFDNISHYQSTAKDEASRFGYRKWSSLKAIPGNEDVDWLYWKTQVNDLSQPYGWRDVLFTSFNDFVGLSGKTIYAKYTGTDHIVVDSDSLLVLNGYRYRIYKDVGWQSAVVTPA